MREVWPFRRPGAGLADFGVWTLVDGDSTRELPDYLEGWDPLTDVFLERVVRCDSAGIRSTTGLRDDVPLLLTVSWISKQSFMTEALYRAAVESEQLVRVTLPSARLGGSIVLRTSISVGSSDSERAPAAPRLVGSILASDERLVVLEGNGPMFPITAVDFAHTRYSANASWALEIPEDLSRPVLGSVLLLINTRDTELGAALSASKPDTRQSSIVENLETQLGARLFAEALSRELDLESDDWEDQSVGALLTGYLRAASRHDTVRSFRTGDAAVIGAALEGAARAEGFGRRFT